MKKKVGIVACSNPMKTGQKENIERLCDVLSDLGKDVFVSPCLYVHADGTFPSGKERAEALMSFYRDPEMDVIFDVSGGDMAPEVLEYLDYSVIRESDAMFAGYSDLTTIVNAITEKAGKISMLWQVRNLLYAQRETQKEALARFLLGEEEALCAFSGAFIRGEAMEGIVVGGNIRCLLKLAGTGLFPDLNGRILLLESYGGGVPQMISYLSQLRLLGAQKKVKGIVLGTFTDMEETNETPTMAELVSRFFPASVPIFQTKQVGHGTDAKAVLVGKTYRFAGSEARPVFNDR